MSPEEIKALRVQLRCTTKELARALAVEPSEVSGWELGELFPTKRSVDAMLELQRRGPDAIQRAPRGKGVKLGLARLEDPRLWELLRKLCQHPTLFDATLKFASTYEDPAAAD